MQYILLIYADEKNMEAGQSDEETKAIYAAYGAYDEEVKKAGVFVAGDALHDTHTATTVRMQGDKVMQTDGPFAETKEQLGGYYVLECKDLDEALMWAQKCPAVHHGSSVEVRPIMNLG